MSDQKKTTGDLLWFLQEREKELNCLYRIDELLQHYDADIGKVCQGIIEAIPPGWQYPNVCQAKIILEGNTYKSANFTETQWLQTAVIEFQDTKIGEISVYYTEEMPLADEGPFLKQETKLLQAIADRISHFIFQVRMKQFYQEYQKARQELTGKKSEEWRVVLNLLKRTDKKMYLNISQKMLNHLCWSGVDEAEELLGNIGNISLATNGEILRDENWPHQKGMMPSYEKLSDDIFKIAAKYLTNDQVLANIQRWMLEDKSSFLVRVVNRNLSLGEVVDAIRKYQHLSPEGIELTPSTERGVEVALTRRFLSNQPHFVNTAKNYLEISDFYEFIDHIIYSKESHGRLGGKSAGLFLAKKIIQKSKESSDELRDIKIPKTWYISSDILLDFLAYNNLDEIVEQKYKDINQVRLEYPHVVQLFKNCRFPADIVQWLSMVLDEFSDRPIIVRSSSLLEDRAGAAFSGKYKSLFIANKGTKQKRLEALTDAIAEVYASTFGPDPIEYRAEKGLLDFGEEMGIMIQEVVGSQVGDYFIPTFAGVAFSRNELRWSPRIKREDGLLRMVPGLGTRAVDRVSDDYPVLIAPGQVDLQVNVSIEEQVRYSPKKIDVINLKTNKFETIRVADLLKKYGEQIPGIGKVVSIHEDNDLRKPLGLEIDFEKNNLVCTFDGLLKDNKFTRQINGLLKLLEKKLGMPVDIEFAHDGIDLYLLQCRPQSYSTDREPATIPRDFPTEKIIFSANRYVSNGRISDISHIVYVDPLSYYNLSDKPLLMEVGRTVSKLNKILPKRKFILMGPGRWGSRGNIKLGVSVTYSDINNTAALIEIARKKGDYLPDLSFGTHFFQDLVESDIRYLPLYPDDTNIIFNETFLNDSTNILGKILPEYKHLADTVKVIDIPMVADGNVLQILMNAEADKALAILVQPTSEAQAGDSRQNFGDPQGNNYWAWRLEMATRIAASLDPAVYGVEGFYVFGSTKNATAGPNSDIDLLIHFRGTNKQRELLLHWLEGWSLCLDQINYFRTGYKTGGLLDIHLITDKDIASKTSYAVKIGAVTDAARPLSLKKRT